MKILHAIHSIDPRMGGTVEALRQIVEQSLEHEQNHEVLCLDDPTVLQSTKFPVPVHPLGPTKRFYGYTPKLKVWLDQHLQEYAIAVIHGCWQYHGLALFRACRRRGIPYLQYPHGMLDPWFKVQYPLKHLKKWLYWPWAEYQILKHAHRVVFTCEEEKRQAAKSFWLYKVHPEVIPLGIRPEKNAIHEGKQEWLRRFPDLTGKRTLLFMSRIHEKKGVELLLDAVEALNQGSTDQSQREDPGVILVIAGPCRSSAYLNQLNQRASRIRMGYPVSGILWPGMLSGPVKWGAFASAEAFILPSHQENFGMVIPEALSCETPVLISNKVNIWREVMETNSGMVEEDSTEGTKQLLCRWLKLNESERIAFRERAGIGFESKFRIEKNAQMLFDLIELTTRKSS